MTHPAPPGYGLVPTVNGHSRFLHDGHARELKDAILWKARETSGTRGRFMHLAGADREAQLFFLESF